MSTTTTTPSLPAPGLAARLGNVRVGLREDLEVSRHLFRGEPSYVIRDPMTGQNQRLGRDDYSVFVAIDSSRSLSDTLQDLTGRGLLKPDDEERFYQFIISLHGLGFLRLPIADHASSYRRYQAKTHAKRMQMLSSFLFLRIPLWNPNAFLEHTMHLARPVFTWGFFALWVALMLAAGYVTAQNWERVREPLEGILIAGNLPLLWITLVILKAFHEFGHAYACKRFGGHVPEMGAYLILFTPCAYVDATASWGFSRKSERIIVCLAGMYIESIFAALGVLVWAATPPSLIHSIAYNVMFLASVVTVFFNINPLMRYDGYYVLSDLAEIPNLRERSARYVTGIAKRWLLGIREPNSPQAWRVKALLFSYGVGAAVYRLGLVIGIAALLASKMLVGGIVLGVLYAGTAAWKAVAKLMRYLWHAEETAPIRGRAMAVGVIVLVLIPAAALYVPLPRRVHTGGVLGRELENVIRVKTPGFLSAAPAIPTYVGSRFVGPGEVLAELSNDAIQEELLQAASALEASQIRQEALRTVDTARALQEQDQAEALREAVRNGQARAAALRVTTPSSGEIVEAVTESDLGSFLPEGAPLATIVSGSWHVRAALTDEQFDRARPALGESVWFRPADQPGAVFQGTVERIAPAVSRETELTSLTQLAGGDIVIDPATGDSIEPRIQVTIALVVKDPHVLRFGMNGVVQFASRAEPLGKSLVRRLLGFYNRLAQS